MKLGPDHRAKTGCMGVLIPLFFGYYAIKWIVHERAGPVSLRTVGYPPLTGEAAVGLGVAALGMRLFVHALGFVPYERILLLKWLLVAAGVTVFFVGVFWTSL